MKLTRFRVTCYRSIRDSGWVGIDDITAFVGQNEAGKSNLFEALYRINPFTPDETYDIDEDWPVDDWGNKDPSTRVCEAEFTLNAEDVAALHAEAGLGVRAETENDAGDTGTALDLPATLTLVGVRAYAGESSFTVQGDLAARFDAARVDAWAKQRVPKLVLIQEYGFSGTQIDLDQLMVRLKNVKWHQLSNEEQTIKTILELARVDVDDFLAKGGTAAGRTVRFFDKRAASAYLSKQFRDLWTQKPVNFHIEIDGSTLNIFAEDDAVGMPVRLHRRSSGFRWHVSFAWKFTQASQGLYKDCILLLEEPGIHLHYAGQRDLLEVFERLSAANTVLYTTHLASMIDPAHPERLRIVETNDSRTTVRTGVVSEQRAPVAVIELALGLNSDMSSLLATRQTLIVESGDDALILQKLSGILSGVSKPHLSDRIYLWPADGARKTPMYAAFAVGQRWDSGVLLGSSPEGEALQQKIEALVRNGEGQARPRFRTLMLGDAAGMQKTDAAVEDLFDNQFYIDCVNAAFGLAIKEADLPTDGSDRIAKRMERVLMERYAHEALDKRRVMSEILRRIDGWEKVSDLPRGTSSRAEKLFMAINNAFGGRQGSVIHSVEAVR